VNKKLGLFGGRFDPVHRAHLAIAIAAANQLKLDEVRWIVTGDPVHKKTFASAKHRLHMVSLALEDLSDKRMKLDSREVLASFQGKSSPTYKTLESLKIEQPKREFLWILGEDQLVNFKTWEKWEWLIENMQIAVCSRPDSLKTNDYSTIESQIKLFQKNNKKIFWVRMPPDECSSTKIREFIAQGYSTVDLTTSSVEKYILKNKIYNHEKE
jgi:nicotinate-nucleotide adenylyltransferase